MNNLGLVFLEQNRADAAMPLFLKAVDIRKGVAAFPNNLGMALEHTWRFKEAADAYNDALSADADYERRSRTSFESKQSSDDDDDDERAGSR